MDMYLKSVIAKRKKKSMFQSVSFYIFVYTLLNRRELYHVGVTSHTIQPGSFKTKIVDPNEMKSTLQRAFDSVDEEVQRFYGLNWLNQSKYIIINLLLLTITGTYIRNIYEIAVTILKLIGD
jgi:hypothetical protein